MDNIIFEPSDQVAPSQSQQVRSKRSDALVARQIMGVLEKAPQGEEDWSDGKPQTDEDVSLLFSRLTLIFSYSRQDRKSLPYRNLLEAFAMKMDPDCQLHVMTLAGACVVAIKQRVLGTDAAREIMRIGVKDPDRVLDGKRRATPKFIRILDVLHAYQALGLRTYELPIRRRKTLNTIASFTERHIDYLIEHLESDARRIYKPTRALDSTCLRIPNIVYVLFAGRFTRDVVEQSLDTGSSESRASRPERATIHIHRTGTTFHQFISLTNEGELERQKASVDVVGLAPTFQRPRLKGYGLPDPYLGLCSFIQALRGSIEAVVESRGWSIMDFNGLEEYPPQVLRFEERCGMTVPSGYLGLMLLLRERQVDLIVHRDQEVVWMPNQVFCYMGEAPRAKDERNRFYCLFTLLQLAPN